MQWVILEALVALALGLLIVWWTMSPARRRDRERERADPGANETATHADDADPR
jgi:hypothetical protein